MNPRELRIGNLVSIFNSICVIDTVALHGCWCTLLESEKDRSLTLEYNAYIEPIPLTEEWLLKFGFKKDTFGSWKRDNCLYWIDKDGGVLQIASGFAAIINAPCQYAHQLQNLYFALTGNELELQ